MACHSQGGGSANKTTEQLTIPEDWPSASPRPGDTLDIPFLVPLVKIRIGDPTCEALVSKISDDKQTVSTLIDLVTTWVRDGFPLMHDNTLHGKHHGLNYKSALSFRAQTHKSLIKRLNTHETAGPYQWLGDVNDSPFDDCATNSLGAVLCKLEPDRARACDDSAINVAITLQSPHLISNSQRCNSSEKQRAQAAHGQSQTSQQRFRP